MGFALSSIQLRVSDPCVNCQHLCIIDLVKRLMKLSNLILYKRESDSLIVRLQNGPSDSTTKFLVESTIGLDEGKVQQWSGGYSSRLDRRPTNQGGEQLHIFGPKNQKWAYRYDGSRSERSKYTLPTTNKVRDIVSNTFGIDRNQIDEMWVASASEKVIILEMVFK